VSKLDAEDIIERHDSAKWLAAPLHETFEDWDPGEAALAELQAQLDAWAEKYPEPRGGRALLAEHDALPKTPDNEWPRLVSLPLPKGWAIEPQGSAGHHHAALDFHVTKWEEAEVRALARAVLALADWLDHEAAVKAQGVSCALPELPAVGR